MLGRPPRRESEDSSSGTMKDAFLHEMAEACLSDPSPSVDHESTNERRTRGAQTVREVSEHAALERFRSLLRGATRTTRDPSDPMFPPSTIRRARKPWRGARSWSSTRVAFHRSAIAARVPRGTPGPGSPGSVPTRSSEHVGGTRPAFVDDHHDAGSVTSAEPTRRRRAVRSVSRTGRRRAARGDPGRSASSQLAHAVGATRR